MSRRRRASKQTATARPSTRWRFLDVARGSAIIAMVVYHFCFDLAWNGWITADFGEDWRWLGFRITILGSFLLIAGMSLAIAQLRGQTERGYWRRIGIVAGAALLVTAGSYAMFPESFIYFGVLHAIALMSILARPLLALRQGLFVLGAVIIVAGLAIASPLFDRRWLHWIGMMTFKPRTEDYVPLFPWSGVFLIGAACGARLVAAAGASGSMSARLVAWQTPPSLAWIEWLGRHSLAVYLVHQPLILGAMLLVRRLL